MRIAIYNECCVMAGKEVSERQIEQADWEGGDWYVYDDEPEALLRLADTIEQNARGGGGGQYDRRVADTIRTAVYNEQPSLIPV